MTNEGDFRVIYVKKVGESHVLCEDAYISRLHALEAARSNPSTSVAAYNMTAGARIYAFGVHGVIDSKRDVSF